MITLYLINCLLIIRLIYQAHAKKQVFPKHCSLHAYYLNHSSLRLCVLI